MGNIEQTSNQAPSIGSIALDFDLAGNRVRQIIQEPIDNLSHLTEALTAANDLALVHGATRRSIRALTRRDLLDLPWLDHQVKQLKYQVEARIHLSGQFNDYYLVYYGGNNPERSSSGPIIAQELGFLSSLDERRRKSPSEIIQKAYQRGYALEKLQGDLSAQDQERLVLMYQQSFRSYPYDIGVEITNLIKNPDSHVFAARLAEDGQLYAIAATELLVIPISNDAKLSIREMGDSARIHVDENGSKEPKGNGLNAPLKLMLINQADRDRLDSVYTESRAALKAVNIINHDIGMRRSGFLLKHSRISGPENFEETKEKGVNAEYGNMNVWALNSDDVIQISAGVRQALLLCA